MRADVRWKRLAAIAVVLLMLLCGTTAMASGLFPKSEELFGVIMPDIRFAVGREPDSIEKGSDGETFVYQSFTPSDYDAYGQYAKAEGLKLKHQDVTDGTLTAELEKDGSSITFQYNYAKKEASVFYPADVRREKEKSDAKLSGTILPDANTIFGKGLPRISTAILRYPDNKETLQDGSYCETYQNFGEQDYASFSSYLKEAECSVGSYYIDDQGALVIPLTMGESSFVFTYDQLRARAVATYPDGVIIETEIPPSAIPTPVPTAAPKATEKPKPTQKTGYSESECWNIAENYLKGILKNPNSLQIHSHTTFIGANSYTFTIDYSAQNGFGGYNRETYFIEVNFNTGKIVSAFGT